MLWGAVQVYKAANDNSTRGLTILPRGSIYPIDWRNTVWGPKDGPGAHACMQGTRHMPHATYATSVSKFGGPRGLRNTQACACDFHSACRMRPHATCKSSWVP
jgi:hypothetical protein